MRAQDIKIGDQLRFKKHPTYSWLKVTEIIPANTGIHKRPFIMVKGIHSVDTNFNFGIVRHIRPRDLVRDQ